MNTEQQVELTGQTSQEKYDEYMTQQLVLQTLLTSRAAVHSSEMSARLSKNSVLVDQLEAVYSKLEGMYDALKKQIEEVE